MNKSTAFVEGMRDEGRLSKERRNFLKRLATAAAIVLGGLLFPRLALAKIKRPRNINKDVGKKKDLPLNAYPSFRKKCHEETYQYYHDASGTVRTFTKTVCD